VILAMLPLMASTFGELFVDRSNDLEDARDRAVELAKLGAEQQDGLLQEARTVMAVLARVPQVTSGEPETCHALLRSLVSDHPRLASLFVSDAKGQVTCNSIAPHPQINVGNRRFVQELLRPGAQGFELSDLSTSLATGKPALFVGLALPPRPGTDSPAGILGAGLNLDWLSNMTAKLAKARLDVPEGTATILDTRTAATLVRFPPDSAAIGEIFSAHPALVAYAVRPNAPGAAEGTAPDGSATIYGYAPLPGTDGQAILVVGFPRAKVLMVANGRLGTAVAIVLAALLLAVAATLAAGWRMLVRPVEQIMGMAAKLSAGDLAARAKLSRWEAPEWHLLATTLNSMAAGVAHTQGQLAESELRFRQLAGTDGLTGLSNRRVFDETYAREWRRAAREHKPLALLLLDVDRFKLFNDQYGHLAGDDGLRLVAATVEGSIGRPGDMVARFGGEEFAILLPGTDAAGATGVAERIRAAVAARGVTHAGNAEGGHVITISVGLTILTPVMDEEPGIPATHITEAMLRGLTEADAALYGAKRAGRNCVRLVASIAESGRPGALVYGRT